MFALLTAIGLVTAAADGKSNADTPRAIIERAIEAQGGEDKVAKLVNGPWRAKVKGKAGWLALTGEILHAPPNGKISTTLGPPGVSGAEVVVVTKCDKAWRRIAGFSSEVTGKELEEMQDGGYRSRKVRFLLPIVREPGFELSLLPDEKISDRPAVGVRVKSKGDRDIDVYFDKETGLLAKTESRLLPPRKPPIVLEQVFSNYREFDGVKVATKFTKYENKKLTSVEEFVDITFVEQIDESEFAKP